jgi:hypothetical protein
MSEMWLVLEGFNKYEIISSDGRIRRSMRETKSYTGLPGRRLKPGGLLKLQTQRHGYKSVTLINDAGAHKTIFVHQAVAILFHGPKPSKTHCACHLDDNKENNTAANIKWGTPKENEADKKRNGKTSLVPWALISNDTAAQIRKLYVSGIAIPCLRKQFSLPYLVTWRVATGRTYKA